MKEDAMRLLMVLAAVSFISAFQFAMAAEHPVSGFVDAQIFTATGPKSSPDFKVNDGALYLQHAMGNAKVVVDLPFSWSPTPVNNLITNNFMFAQGKAQAYVYYKYDLGLYWMLGQFDATFGYEKKDTKDVVFSNQGRLYSFLPVTNTGFLLGYAVMDSLDVKAFVANAYGLGARNGQNLAYGLQIAYTGMVDVTVGGTFNKALNNQNTYLVDLVVAKKLDKLQLAVGLDGLQAPVAGQSMGIGVLGEGVYDLTEKYAAGARIEFLSKMPAMLRNWAANNSEIQVTVGPQVKMTENLKAKLDYTFNSTKAVSGGTSATTHGGALAAVYAF